MFWKETLSNFAQSLVQHCFHNNCLIWGGNVMQWLDNISVFVKPSIKTWLTLTNNIIQTQSPPIMFIRSSSYSNKHSDNVSLTHMVLVLYNTTLLWDNHGTAQAQRCTCTHKSIYLWLKHTFCSIVLLKHL